MAEVLVQFIHTHSADLVVVGTSSRAGLGKLILGSTAEELIHEAPCPVLTVGPHVMARPSAGIRVIVCATDLSSGSAPAVEFALFLAREYQASLALVHAVEGTRTDGPHLALPITEKCLREMIPADSGLLHEPKVIVEVGPVADRILGIASEMSADIVVMGVTGAGAFAHTASHFGSMAHKVVSHAICPVLTVGTLRQAEFEFTRTKAA